MLSQTESDFFELYHDILDNIDNIILQMYTKGTAIISYKNYLVIKGELMKFYVLHKSLSNVSDSCMIIDYDIPKDAPWIVSILLNKEGSMFNKNSMMLDDKMIIQTGIHVQSLQYGLEDDEFFNLTLSEDTKISYDVYLELQKTHIGIGNKQIYASLVHKF